MRFPFFLSILLLSSPAFARGGDSGGGGGDAIVCNEYGTEHVYLADTYDIFKRTSRSLLRLNIGPASISQEAALRVFQQRDLQAGRALRKSLKKLKFIFVAKSLPDVKDDDIQMNRFTFFNCRKEQLAVQNFQRGEVLINESLFKRLTLLEQGLLRVHEAQVSQHPNVYSRAFIRDLMENVVHSDEYRFHAWNVLAERAPKTFLYDMAYASMISQHMDCLATSKNHLFAYRSNMKRDLSMVLTMMETTEPSVLSKECGDILDHFGDIYPLLASYRRITSCRYGQSGQNAQNELTKQAYQLRKNYLRYGHDDIFVLDKGYRGTMHLYAQELGKLLCP